MKLAYMEEWLGRNHCLQKYDYHGLRNEKIGLYMNGNPLFGQTSPNSTHLEMMGEKKKWRGLIAGMYTANREIWRGKCYGVGVYFL